LAKSVVIAVGPNSQWGKIKATLDKEQEDTPLQAKLEGMADNIGKLGVIAATFTLLALLLKWSITDYGIHYKTWVWSELGRIVHFVITAITIIVVAVPEGLPLAVTLALAFSMFKMMKDNNLVRHLAACETMGGATQICSDKTGTLTQNKMTAVKLKLGGVTFDNVHLEEPDLGKVADGVRKIFMEGVCVNSFANITKDDNGKEMFTGPPTEGSLLVLARTFGTNYDELREQFPVPEKRVVWPFSSKKKRMSSLLTVENGYRLHCKGASEVVLELCTHMLNSSGEKVDITSEKDNLRAMIDEWASLGYRTLSIAYTELPSSFKLPSKKASEKESKEEISEGEAPADENDDGPLDHDLTLVGIVGIEDPVRKEVPDSVATCQRAGITVRMLTGDNILTAKQIAKQCGILKEDGLAIEGPKFRTLSAEEIDKIIPRLQVIARCSPEDKLILVKRLRHLGEVVAVTGDGTNDAPILKEADVGFAMGISGTDVAKDASDIILLDDNFSSIEKAVLWGRNVYDSIRKFLQFQLTVNIVAVLVAFIGAVTTGESPLKAVQLLWVNLIMDTFAALALATEPPTPELMQRPPYGRYAPLITYRMWRAILGQAFFQLFVCLFTLYGAQTISFLEVEGTSQEVVTGNQDDKRRTTIVFNTFVICQLFNEINARKLGNELNMFRGIHKNWIFIVILIGSFVVQFILVQFAGAFAKTVALTGYQWFSAFSLECFLFLLDFFFVSFPCLLIYKTRTHN